MVHHFAINANTTSTTNWIIDCLTVPFITHFVVVDKVESTRQQNSIMRMTSSANDYFRHLQIAKDARECIQECVSEFISFITSEASDRCHQEKRKTINGEDILFAMCALGFDHYIDPLTLYLHKYRETTKSDRNLVINHSESSFDESANEFNNF